MMASLSVRCYAGDRDLSAIAHLINTCEQVDRLDEGTSISELQQEFNAPFFNKSRDIRLWEDAEGKLIGFAQLSVSEPGEVIDGWLWFRVHPEARGGDVEAAAIAWGEVRMREVSAMRGARVKLRTYARAEDCDRISVLTSCGFKGRSLFLPNGAIALGTDPRTAIPRRLLAASIPGRTGFRSLGRNVQPVVYRSLESSRFNGG